MSALRRTLERATGLRRRRRVPIQRLRCNIKPIAKEQGFSGEPISAFPACQAFQIYLERPADAKRYFADWYRRQIFEREVWRYPKAQGGMATGSLIRAVERLHRRRGLPWSGFATADPEIVEQGIQQRIDAYFSLLVSIQNEGFHEDHGPPIRCWRRKGLYVLIDGHHRTSALFALGRREAPVEITALLPLRKALYRARRSLASNARRKSTA